MFFCNGQYTLDETRCFMKRSAANFSQLLNIIYTCYNLFKILFNMLELPEVS